MSNMSYCRFENTDSDLQDCVQALHDRDDLSESEAAAAKRLIKRCREIIEGVASEFDVLDDGELTDAQIDEFVDEWRSEVKADEDGDDDED